MSPDAEIDLGSLYKVYTGYCEDARLRSYEILGQAKFAMKFKRQPGVILDDKKLIGVTLKSTSPGDISEVSNVRINVLRKVQNPDSKAN